MPNHSPEQNIEISWLLYRGKFKFSAQDSDLAPFVANRTKVKIPSEIKPPLVLINADAQNLRPIFIKLTFETQL